MPDFAAGLAQPPCTQGGGGCCREEEFELPFLDLEEETGIDKVEIETIREIEQGKKWKNKLGELLRRRRAPQYGSEGRIVIG